MHLVFGMPNSTVQASNQVSRHNYIIVRPKDSWADLICHTQIREVFEKKYLNTGIASGIRYCI